MKCICVLMAIAFLSTMIGIFELVKGDNGNDDKTTFCSITSAIALIVCVMNLFGAGLA